MVNLLPTKIITAIKHQDSISFEQVILHLQFMVSRRGIAEAPSIDLSVSAVNDTVDTLQFAIIIL
jgi:hypothetical protein